jgi:hypothetical protein
MTKNQEKLIRFIADYRTRYCALPTLQEMADGINVSDHKSVSGIISALMKQGFLEKGHQKIRAVLLTNKAFELLDIPLLRRQRIEEFNYSNKQTFPTGSDVITSQTADYVGYGDKSIKTDSTNLSNDLHTIVGNTVANIANKVYTHKEIGIIFRWALLFSGLTWVNVNIIGNNTTALVWTVIETITIKLLSKKITL